MGDSELFVLVRGTVSIQAVQIGEGQEQLGLDKRKQGRL